MTDSNTRVSFSIVLILVRKGADVALTVRSANNGAKSAEQILAPGAKDTAKVGTVDPSG